MEQFNTDFLPLTPKEAAAHGWQLPLDFVVVTGDAYVDHPSFGAAIIGRLLQAQGYSVGIISQPDFTDAQSFTVFGKPKYGFFIGGGNVDSMVAHYSVAKKRRTMDEYTPGGVTGKRPDRAASVYTKLAKQAYPHTPVILGGLEASLRRFAHYDYWMDVVLPSIVESSGADLVSFGMSEHQTVEIARRLVAGESPQSMHDINGTCYMVKTVEELPPKYIECAAFNKVSADKTAYAKACRIQLDNQDVVTAKPVVQKQKNGYLVQNIPATPLTRRELDEVYALPYTRRWHPSYDALGGVPGLEEVEFSIIQNRGCYGGCNFCAITLHQGRRVTSRSKESIVAEGKLITEAPGFKGYIHDVGGPTANFRLPSCAEQMQRGMCNSKKCLAPQACSHLIVDHSDYLDILRTLRSLPKVKKVFIRSGIRYDYLIHDKDETFFKELIEHHVSGQLKVAPEHCAPTTLAYMGKPPIEFYNRFTKRFYELTKQAGKKQYLVPYLMSSHPGSTLKDAVILAEYLYKNKVRPEQVQDFYPTPGTVSTCMFYTELDPYTLKPVYVAKTAEEKSMQRALLQYYNPRNKEKVLAALKQVDRRDLIPLLLPYGNAENDGNPKAKPAQQPHKNGVKDMPQSGAGNNKKKRGVELWQPPTKERNQPQKRGKKPNTKRR
ncbi:MAG: YgiQ family radical SAM protein [Oscillospiraceae bacterium]|nr:YgiQ family radical SAM protein [Oscillospiraceae bacterium]